jgi:hypothetical protein
VLLGVLAAIGILEVALRVTGWQPPATLSKQSLIDRAAAHRTWYDCYPSNPNGEFERSPDVSAGSWLLVDNLLPPDELPLAELARTPWCVRYRLSSQGLRDFEYTPAPRAGIARIGVVGDSFVFGEGVPETKNLCAALRDRTGASTEIVNLGWPGDDTRRELERLEQATSSLHIERALIVFIANDIEMSPELQHEQEYIHDLIQVRDRYLERRQERFALFGWSRLFRLASRAWEMREIKARTIQWYRELYDPARNAAGLQRFAGYLARLAKLPSCRVALVMFPLLEGLEQGYPLQDVHRRVQAMAEGAGLRVLDLAPTFAGRPTASLWVHPCDHHPNGGAHAIAARAIAAWLEHDAPEFTAR